MNDSLGRRPGRSWPVGPFGPSSKWCSGRSYGELMMGLDSNESVKFVPRRVDQSRLRQSSVPVDPSSASSSPTSALHEAVYRAVYVEWMRRTNIYLTDTEQAALDARAIAEGSTRSEILRVIVDRQLNLGEDTDVDAALGQVAAELAERARTISSDDVDLHIA